jgi:hypothetical protein
MARNGRLAVWLAVPLIVVLVAAFGMYGVEGPPDTAPVNTAARAIGLLYAFYAVAVVLIWRKSGR